ncbi:MAG: hypothetical protein BGP09_04180 [Rhizobium sp. 60-20]|nr:MAG: hypothetical protein BGP09_04180 [Rhizobium sp. 60-20]
MGCTSHVDGVPSPAMQVLSAGFSFVKDSGRRLAPHELCEIIEAVAHSVRYLSRHDKIFSQPSCDCHLMRILIRMALINIRMSSVFE